MAKPQPKPTTPRPTTMAPLSVTVTLDGAAREAWERIKASGDVRAQAPGEKAPRPITDADLAGIALQALSQAFLKPNDPALRY